MFNFKTDRLLVQECINNHVNVLMLNRIPEILSPEVTKALPDGWQHITSAQKAEHWIAERLHESIVLTIKTTSDTELIGFVFLYITDGNDDRMDLRFGYLLDKAFWGKGFGTEVITGLVEACKASGKVKTLSGGVEVDNIGSVKVLERCEFTALKPEHEQDDVVFYETVFLDK